MCIRALFKLLAVLFLTIMIVPLYARDSEKSTDANMKIVHEMINRYIVEQGLVEGMLSKEEIDAIIGQMRLELDVLSKTPSIDNVDLKTIIRESRVALDLFQKYPYVPDIINDVESLITMINMDTMLEKRNTSMLKMIDDKITRHSSFVLMQVEIGFAKLLKER